MDDLKMIGTLLTVPGPSEDVVDRGRRQLAATMHGAARGYRARTRWLAAGTGLTAAAAAAAALVLGTVAPDTPAGHPSAAAPAARQILLAAASSAERASAGSGIYWHVTTQFSDSPSDRWQTWTLRDGQTWWTKGSQVLRGSRQPFYLAGKGLSFAQLQDLPTGPAALKAWIIHNAIEHGGKGGPFGRRAPSKTMEQEVIFTSLAALVTDLPVPSALRAAAFRVMASFPGVRSLGPVPGGQGLLIPLGGQPARIVVDPATSRVRDTNFFVSEGAQVSTQSPTTATVTAGWTNHLPKVTVIVRPARRP